MRQTNSHKTENQCRGNRHAQMEMIGLVVIVVLLTLGLLFMALFALKEDPGEKTFLRKGIARSTMSAVLSMTVEECGSSPLQVERDLIDDCAQNYELGSPSLYAVQCSVQRKTVSSCEYLNTLIPSVLNQTLGQWQKRYHFVSELSGKSAPLLYVESAKGNCHARERDVSGEFILPTIAGPVKSMLFVCD